MSNKKATKRALLTSILAICLCLVMLIGSTFAWFTDTASTSVNMIQSGTLNVELYYQDTIDGKGESWTKVDANTKLNFLRKTENGVAQDAGILWEPGATYYLPALKVVNEGNLALKYKIVINGATGDTKLMDVIDWTYGISGGGGADMAALETERHLTAKPDQGESADILTISGKMRETAGNDYQNKTISNITITVLATQDTVEFDSTTNLYDKDATYPVTDAASMKDALDEINNSEEVNSGVLVLKEDFSYDNAALEVKNGKDIAINLAGNDLTIKNENGDGIAVSGGGTLTLGNSGTEGKYVFDCQASGSDGIFVNNTEAGKTTTLNINSPVEIHVDAAVNTAIHAYAQEGSAVVNIKGTTIKVTGDQQTKSIVVDQNSTLNIEDATLELSCDFDSYSDGNDVVGILLWGQNGKQENIAVNINGNTKIKVGGKNAFAQGIQIGMKNGYSENLNVTMNGGEIELAPTENGKGYAFTTYKGEYGTFVMNGGTISGNVDALALAYIGTTNLTINGGTFAADPTGYLGAGHTATNNNGTWTVK